MKLKVEVTLVEEISTESRYPFFDRKTTIEHPILILEMSPDYKLPLIETIIHTAKNQETLIDLPAPLTQEQIDIIKGAVSDSKIPSQG